MSEETTEAVVEEREPFDLEAALNGDQRFESVKEETEEDEEEETTEDKGDETEKEGEEEEKVEEEVEMYSMTINGEEREFTLDELKTLASKGEGAEKKFHEAAEGRRQLEEVFQSLNKDTWSVLEKMGKDPVKMAEDFLYEKYNLESMTPEERELATFKKEKAAFDEQKQMSARQTQEAEVAKLAEQNKIEFETKFEKSLEEVGLPKNADTLSRMASYTKEALSAGYEVDTSDIAKVVAEDILNANKKTFDEMTPEAIEKAFGKDFLKKVKNFELKKVKSAEDGNRVKSKTTSKPRGKAPKKVSIMDAFKEIGESFG